MKSYSYLIYIQCLLSAAGASPLRILRTELFGSSVHHPLDAGDYLAEVEDDKVSAGHGCEAAFPQPPGIHFDNLIQVLVEQGVPVVLERLRSF